MSAPPLSKVVGEFKRGLSIARHGGWKAGWGFVREEVLRNSWVRILPPPPEESAPRSSATSAGGAARAS